MDDALLDATIFWLAVVAGVSFVAMMILRAIARRRRDKDR